MINAPELTENYLKKKGIKQNFCSKRKYENLNDLTSSEVYGYTDNAFRTNLNHIKKRKL
jgi:hypothetical protein